jgi:hypothetical protein
VGFAAQLLCTERSKNEAARVGGFQEMC